MDDAADHTAVVNTGLTPRIRRQMRRDSRELRVREPKPIPIHPCFLQEAVNHAEMAKPTTLWVRALRQKVGTIEQDAFLEERIGL